MGFRVLEGISDRFGDHGGDRHPADGDPSTEERLIAGAERSRAKAAVAELEPALAQRTRTPPWPLPR